MQVKTFDFLTGNLKQEAHSPLNHSLLVTHMHDQIHSHTHTT